jgi:hypothetical protein
MHFTTATGAAICRVIPLLSFRKEVTFDVSGLWRDLPSAAYVGWSSRGTHFNGQFCKNVPESPAD